MTPCFMGKPCLSFPPASQLYILELAYSGRLTSDAGDVTLELVTDRVEGDLLAHVLVDEDTAASSAVLYSALTPRPSPSQTLSSTIPIPIPPFRMPSPITVVENSSNTHVRRSSSKSKSFWAPVAGLEMLSFMATGCRYEEQKRRLLVAPGEGRGRENSRSRSPQFLAKHITAAFWYVGPGGIGVSAISMERCGTLSR